MNVTVKFMVNVTHDVGNILRVTKRHFVYNLPSVTVHIFMGAPSGGVG